MTSLVNTVSELILGDLMKSLPQIMETLENLGGSRYFTTIELASGNHQIPIQPEDCENTAFSTILSIGGWLLVVVNVLAAFQRLMDHLLAEIKRVECLVFLDDVIIYSFTLEEHCR